MNAEIQDTRTPQGRKSGAGGLASPLYLTAILHCLEVIWFKKEFILFAEFFDGTLCTEITHPSRTPHEPEATKVSFQELKRLPASLASPSCASMRDGPHQVTTPSHRVVKFISSFKQKQSFPAWNTPRHSWHGNEPDLLIDELRVPTGHPV